VKCDFLVPGCGKEWQVTKIGGEAVFLYVRPPVEGALLVSVWSASLLGRDGLRF